MEDKNIIENLHKIIILYKGIQDILFQTKVNEVGLFISKRLERNDLGKIEEVSNLIISYDTSNGSLDKQKDYGDLYDLIFVKRAIQEFDFFADKEISKIVQESSLSDDEKIIITKNSSVEEFLKLSFSKYVPVLLHESLDKKLSETNKSSNHKIKV